MTRSHFIPLPACVAIAWLVITAAGCSTFVKDLPPGTQIQSSTTGFRVAPRSPDAPLMLGQATLSIQTPTPDGSGPSLNRNQIRAGLTGVDVTSTVASGPVGEQLQAAGGPEALAELLRTRIPGAATEVPPASEPGRDADD